MTQLFVADASGKLVAAECTKARELLVQLQPIVDSAGLMRSLGSVSSLAERQGLSTYDASYFELALRSGLPLASRDAKIMPHGIFTYRLFFKLAV